MTLKHLLLATTVALGLQAAPALAQDAAVEAMQEYMMFSEYESGIILPQQLDQTVFETALFVDTRDADQFEEGTIPAPSTSSGARCSIASTRSPMAARAGTSAGSATTLKCGPVAV